MSNKIQGCQLRINRCKERIAYYDETIKNPPTEIYRQKNLGERFKQSAQIKLIELQKELSILLTNGISVTHFSL